MVVYDNGLWLDGSEATNAHSLGLTRGVAVFNTLRTWQGRLAFVTQSIARLCDMSRQIGATIEPSQLEDLVREALRRNQPAKSELSMRVIVAPGTGQTLSLRQKGEPSIHVLLEAVTPRPNLALTLKTVGFYRQEPKLKHTNYFAAFVAMTAAAKQGFDDILHTDAAPNPRLVEISRNNIVFIKDTTLLAPNKDIYPGLIREVLLHRAHEAGLKVVERDVLASELDTIDAVFATGVTYGPRPVIAIDQHRFASDTHEAFTHLHQIYLDALRANV